jgi:hypothetical protein
MGLCRTCGRECGGRAYCLSCRSEKQHDGACPACNGTGQESSGCDGQVACSRCGGNGRYRMRPPKRGKGASRPPSTGRKGPGIETPVPGEQGVPETALDAAHLSREEFARVYEKPVHHYLRGTLCKTEADVQAVAQAFFVRLGDQALLSRSDPRGAGFRALLKSTLRQFTLDRDEATGRSFAFNWKRALIADAVEDLRPRLDGLKLKIFDAYYGSGGRPTYDQVASQLGLTQDDVMRSLVDVQAEIQTRLEKDR